MSIVIINVMFCLTRLQIEIRMIEHLQDAEKIFYFLKNNEKKKIVQIFIIKTTPKQNRIPM